MRPSKRELLIWLSHLAEINYQTIVKLETYFGDLEMLWSADPKHLLSALGNRSIIGEKIIQNRKEDLLKKCLEGLRQKGYQAYTWADESYPAKLRHLYDPPAVLYVKGRLELNGPLIAMVGSRKATTYGKWAGHHLSKKLAEAGVGIISGIALGVDTVCHQGALAGGGYTAAVLGSGLDVCYPASNRKLSEQILEKGCLISEYCPGSQPLKHHFPARNRLVSGLSDGVAVIEAAEKSGALLTVDFALQQGKEVYALPGNIQQSQSRGTNLLIREGAKLLLDPEDILEELKGSYPQLVQAEKELAIALSDDELTVYRLIKREPLHADQIVYEGKLPVQQVYGILTALELKGFITQLPGKIFTAIR